MALGTSNLEKRVKHFMDVGYEVIDLTIPGWVVSAANVENLLKVIKDTNIPSNAKVVLDLFGNSACRWAQEDGTEALPVRTGSGYHLPGPVSACSDRVFTKLIKITLPLFLELQKNEKSFSHPFPGTCSGGAAGRMDMPTMSLKRDTRWGCWRASLACVPS